MLPQIKKVLYGSDLRIGGAVLSHTKELFDMVIVKVLYP